MLTLVQMHGEPGSGKSTLARAIGRALPAVVLDKDIVSSALLKAWLAPGSIGPASYETLWGLSRSILEQGFSVIVDSPAGWPSIEQSGKGVASATHAQYAMIECTCPDRVELARRLSMREALPSQPREIVDWYARPGAAEPTCARLRLECTRPVAELATLAIDYIRGVTPNSSLIAHRSSPAEAAS